MIYTVRTTTGRGRPIQVLLNDKDITYAVYLDRRRRVIRRYKTGSDGQVMIIGDRAVTEEIRYHHRDRICIVHRVAWRAAAQ